MGIIFSLSDQLINIFFSEAPHPSIKGVDINSVFPAPVTISQAALTAFHDQTVLFFGSFSDSTHNGNRDEVKPITWKQFDWLMSGLEVEQPKALKMDV